MQHSRPIRSRRCFVVSSDNCWLDGLRHRDLIDLTYLHNFCIEYGGKREMISILSRCKRIDMYVQIVYTIVTI